ncbi:membrane protein [Marivirga lumbricoides]|uniref:Membrane protein n=2 Tax=Marivirga lumbricoides TaxID=1046115 RepID=A0A2T4DVL6_9BACT|nr:hypothetical protein C9994_01265 [Marivirga lumbricoides]GGC28841.1 membrane protein [Marivirga lumbricoides]
MGYTMKTALGRLRIMAILEGISYILLGITMPLKYLNDMPLPNYIVGMIHGVLFIMYCLLVVIVAVKMKWKFKMIVLAFLASLIPFGTFYADWKWFKMMEINNR